jgi:hypothetical protein
MGSWLSVIASIVIGGLVLLSFGRFNHDVNKDMYLDVLDNAAYGNLAEVVRIIEYDFFRIGLNINDPKQAVLVQASPTELRFNLDSDGNNVVETMRYYLGDSTSAASTNNPRDKVLYRVVNGGTPQAISAGLTDFRIKYFTVVGNQTTVLDSIRTFEVSITMESDIIYDNQYPKMFWQGRVTPPSLVTH